MITVLIYFNCATKNLIVKDDKKTAIGGGETSYKMKISIVYLYYLALQRIFNKE
jgi:hypothetical protein